MAVLAVVLLASFGIALILFLGRGSGRTVRRRSAGGNGFAAAYGDGGSSSDCGPGDSGGDCGGGDGGGGGGGD